jgi:long-chain acyl-CoA synthetase
LRGVGLVAAPNEASLDQLTTSCSLAIFEMTCAEWMIAALGAFSQSMIVTTLYSTLGMDAVVDAVKDGVIRVLLCNKRNLGVLLPRLEDMPTLKCIIYTDNLIAANEEVPIPVNTSGVNVISFDDFIASGDTTQYPPTPPDPKTAAVLMYTSGSTGKPKGVVLTHMNVVSSVGACKVLLPPLDDGVYLSYLPLAHILELTAQLCMLGDGCTVCYADPKTLTATGASPIGALEQFSPTVMAAVPKIWDTIKKGVEGKLSLASPVARFLVDTAFEARSFAIAHGYDTPLFKLLVFNKFAKVVGGKLKFALSGGGPLNSEVQFFIRTAFGCPLVQGYGLTETCSSLSLQDTADLRSGIAGVPSPANEVKLESCPGFTDKSGLPYLVTDMRDTEGNSVFGRGEILVKGNTVALGYYMMPQISKEEGLGPNSWFHTGDIGQFMSDGSIRIVDRKKNLVKLKGGEYISLETMEGAYGNSSFVDAVAGGICCYGDGDMDRPIALMQLNKTTTMKWAQEKGISGDFLELASNKDLHGTVMADLQNECKKSRLSHLEKIVAVSFIVEPWTPENGCLTAANKLQRRAVIIVHKNEFEETKMKGIF